MAAKPIFVATHPRACSTAFERVFMTRKDSLQCIHEPFGDAFYFGPERLSARYEDDKAARVASGFSASTYKDIVDRIESESDQGKRVFIKDIIHYLVPPDGKPASIAPSLVKVKRGIGTNGESNGLANGHASAEEGNGVAINGGAQAPPYPFATEAEPENPTVVPLELLSKFHFTFLIRDPHYSIPSYFRCTIPPLDDVTGFHDFSPSEAGYDEVRRVFDYLRKVGLVGPRVATTHAEDAANKETAARNGISHQGTGSGSSHRGGGVEICVVDADDLLDNPYLMIEAYCKSVGIPFEPEMLRWDTEEDHANARAAFEKWKGFHEDAIASRELKPRAHAKLFKSEEEFDAEWREKFGEKGAKIIRETVNRNMADYHYMKQFALKV